MKNITLRQSLLLIVGAAIGFIGSVLMSQSTVQAQTEARVNTESYGLITAEFFPGNREKVMLQFSQDVEQQLQDGWQCLGGPILDRSNSELQPTVIMQAMIRE